MVAVRGASLVSLFVPLAYKFKIRWLGLSHLGAPVDLNCQYCGKDEPLPFVCNYCGGVFCVEHRLPETHSCTGDLSRRPEVVVPATSYSWSGYTYTGQARRRAAVFSTIEVRDIVIAWLGLGVAFFMSGFGGALGLPTVYDKIFRTPKLFAEFFVVALATVGSGFVLHELSHKFTAQRFGYWAEFRMWPFGLVLALVTSLIGFIFAAPGATYISGFNISESENGKISVAGPLMNVIVGIIFLPFLLFGHGVWYDLGSEGVFVNIFLALFNMLPLYPLDGAKVFAWSKLRWAAVFVPLVLVFIVLVGG